VAHRLHAYPFALPGKGAGDQAAIEIEALVDVCKRGDENLLFGVLCLQADAGKVESVGIDPEIVEQLFLAGGIGHVADLPAITVILLELEQIVAGRFLSPVAVHAPRAHRAQRGLAYSIMQIGLQTCAIDGIGEISVPYT
jgi:hypothetical protein